MKGRFTQTSPRALFAGLIALLALAGWAPKALAAATSCSSTGGTLSLPTSIAVPRDAPVGSLLGNAATVPVTFNCSGLPYNNTEAGQTATMQAGDLAAPDASDAPGTNTGIVFATNIPGIALKVTASPVQADDLAWIRGGPGSTRGFEPGAITVPSSYWKCGRICTGTGSGSVTETFTAQLVKTGSVSAGTINAISLMNFYWYIYGIGPTQTPSIGSLKSTSTVIKSAACNVNTGSKNFTVTLPGANTSDLPAVGSTAKKTAFSIGLTCDSGTTVNVTMDAANDDPDASHPGVILGSTGAGNAQGVGVQILDRNSQPITFGSKQSAGNSTASMSIPYYVQYFRTGAISSGAVNAQASFTMSYE